MKSLFLFLGILLTNFSVHAADKIINCNFVPGRCECQVMKQVTIQSDGFSYQETYFQIKQCPAHIREKLSSEYMRAMHEFNNQPLPQQTAPHINLKLPEDAPSFNNSPFAQMLANGLANVFGRHQAGPTQSYIDQLRSWRPIDAQMARDMENFRQERMEAQGKLSEGDKEILDYLNEIIKQSQDLTKESRLPREERPTPLPKSVDPDEIRQIYQGLYQSAAANRAVELEQGIRNILKGLQSMNLEERAFHQTELSRTFLRRDLTFKSLPYVNNPDLNLKSELTSQSGMATRVQINNLMALKSQVLQRLHGHCEMNGCADPEKLVQDVNHTSGQIFKNIELRDQLAGTFVEDQSFNKLSKDLFNEYSTGLSKVRTEEDFQSLKHGVDRRMTELQERRLSLKSELLASNGGRYNLPEFSKNQLASMAGELRRAATLPGMEANSQMFRDLAEGSLDLALGLIPIVSTAKDFFEMVSGTSLISGEKLDVNSRSILAVGVLVDLATFGTGGVVVRALSKAEGLTHFFKNTLDVIDAPGLVTEAKKIIDSAGKLGLSTGKQIRELIGKPIGKSWAQIQAKGKVKVEGGVKFFNSEMPINNPLPQDGVFARVVPKHLADKIKIGDIPLSRTGPGNEAFVTAFEDIRDISNPSDFALRLSLYVDEAATAIANTSDNVVLKFKFKDDSIEGLRSPIELLEKRGFGFLPGGRTHGNAREWLIDNDAFQNGVIYFID